MNLKPIQKQVIEANETIFLIGPAGTGKTTTLQHRLLHLLRNGEPAYTILVLIAEATHESKWLNTIHNSGLGPYANLKITTYNQMALEMVQLFWPLVARPAGFISPYRPPTILGYDLAQILMWRIVSKMIEAGTFATLRSRPQEIVTQLLDILNGAALNRMTPEQAIERQKLTWAGEPEQIRHLDDAYLAITSFRKFCLENSLLDLSLVISVFDRQLVEHPEFHRYFKERYRHLLVDNIEEGTAAAQNFVQKLMGSTVSAAIAYDEGGGYKRFMAADPNAAIKFRKLSRHVFEFHQSFVASEPLQHLANLVENQLMVGRKLPTAQAEKAILGIVNGRYRREMVTNLTPILHELIHKKGYHPSDIAIITPYLDGALRYTLIQSLREANLPNHLTRRRSSPRDEPRVRAWLTWLALAHPDWGIKPSPYDIAEALTLSIHGMDPVRAALTTQALYDKEIPRLLPTETAPEFIRERIGNTLLTLVDELREWLETHGNVTEFDRFLHALFTYLLSQPRFQPEPDIVGAAVCRWLVDTATRVRQAAPALGFKTPAEIGYIFIESIYQGLVSARPPELGAPPDPEGIMVTTMYNFLLSERVVKIQVWLETAATGWWDLLKRPLSNAFVLAQSWEGNKWTMEDDFKIRNELLVNIIRGLTSRCEEGIILATSDLDRRGLRQEGRLWQALQPVIRHHTQAH